MCTILSLPSAHLIHIMHKNYPINLQERESQNKKHIYYCPYVSSDGYSCAAKRCIQFWVLPRFYCTCMNFKTPNQ